MLVNSPGWLGIAAGTCVPIAGAVPSYAEGISAHPVRPVATTIFWLATKNPAAYIRGSCKTGLCMTLPLHIHMCASPKLSYTNTLKLARQLASSLFVTAAQVHQIKSAHTVKAPALHHNSNCLHTGWLDFAPLLRTEMASQQNTVGAGSGP
jgi:hypothetical protein